MNNAETLRSGAASRPRVDALPRSVFGLLVGAVIVIIDQATKWWAVAALEDGPCSVDGACVDVFWTLRWNLVRNPGASFSSFTGSGPLLGVIAAGMAVFLLVQAHRSEMPRTAALYGGIAGGAVGNLLDRIFRAEDGVLSGEVIDFIDFQWWPIFNIADIAVVGGVALLAFHLWLAETPRDGGEES